MKDELRHEMKLKRRALTDKQIQKISSVISEKIFKQREIINAASVMVYKSSFNEVSTDNIINGLFELNKRVSVPISNTETEAITVSYIDKHEKFLNGAYGIKEPESIKKAELSDIDVILVPGLAFDLKLNRLGFGKGCYDKLLSDFHGIKIGIAYDFQITKTVFPSPHDVPMDMIITEKRIINAF